MKPEELLLELELELLELLELLPPPELVSWPTWPLMVAIVPATGALRVTASRLSWACLSVARALSMAALALSRSACFAGAAALP